MLSIDKNFHPASENDGDEFYQNGIFLFNMNKITEYIHKHNNKITPESIEAKNTEVVG